MNQSWYPLQSISTKTFQENMVCMRTLSPQLYEELASQKDFEPLLIQHQGNRIRCKIDHSPELWILGESDDGSDLKTIQRTIRQIPTSAELIVMLGTGIGYALSLIAPQILKRSNFRVLAIEPTLTRLRALLHFVDIRPYLQTGRLMPAYAAIDTEGIFNCVERYRAWNLGPPYFYISKEINFPPSVDALTRRYEDRSRHVRHERITTVEALSTRPADPSNRVRRVLLIDCWPGAPGSAHLHAIQQALRQRSIDTRTIQMNRYQIESQGVEYRRIHEPVLLKTLYEFDPDLTISYGYHAPLFAQEEVYAASRCHWLQAVSNIAYFDTRYYAGEYTALIESHLIPIFRRRRAPNPFFIPLMADYTSAAPTPTQRTMPVVFVGNSLGLSPAAASEFMKRWQGRERLVAYLYDSEQALSEYDPSRHLYQHINDHPIPEVDTLEEEYAVFRFLLCQGSAARRRKLLERLVPYGLYLFGGDWEGVLPQQSPLRQCLKGYLPMQEELKIFSQGHIFVNIHSVGHVTGPNMRFMNVAGMGGFQIGDNPSFSRYLAAGDETVYYASESELIDRVAYYTTHPSAAEAIRAQAHARIQRDWTYRNWVDWAFRELGLRAPDA